MLAETYEVYLRILNTVQRRIHAELGWNTPNWRVENACKACCYQVLVTISYRYHILYLLTPITSKLKDEPAVAYSRLWAHDGNNSLKRMLPLNNRVAADTRVYGDSDYFLQRSFVDRYANEVKSGPSQRHREIRSAGQDSESEDEPSQEKEESGECEGDPTDGTRDMPASGIDQCVKNWKAAASDNKKRSWAIFDKTGIYASACRHGLILWICDMVRSGEL